MKNCKDCGLRKPIDCFRSHGKYTRHECRDCENLKLRARRKSNRDLYLSQSRRHHHKNKEKRNRQSREWKKRNPDAVRRSRKIYYEKNKEKELSAGREYKKKYYEINSEEIIRKSIEYRRKRYLRDPEFRASVSLRGMIRRVAKLTIDGRRTSEILDSVGYTPSDLRLRIEHNFQPGMSWKNYHKWHIDHTIPVSHFIAKGEFRPSVINALCNLRPMWAKDNISKGAKHPFKR